MKILAIMFTMLFAIVALADIGPIGRSTNVDFDGSITNGTLEQRYENVINRASSAYADGSIMIWDISNDDGASVTGSVAAGAYPACVLDEACAAGALCKCQTYGYKSAVLFDSTAFAASAGQQMFISESTPGYIQATSSGTIAVSDVSVGMFYDTAAASASVEAFIKIK